MQYANYNMQYAIYNMQYAIYSKIAIPPVNQLTCNFYVSKLLVIQQCHMVASTMQCNAMHNNAMQCKLVNYI